MLGATMHAGSEPRTRPTRWPKVGLLAVLALSFPSAVARAEEGAIAPEDASADATVTVAGDAPVAVDDPVPVDEAVVGHVVSVGRFRADVDLPTPVAVGDRLAIRVHVDDFCPYRVDVATEDCRVVARVIAVEGSRATVSLGLHEVVAVGEEAWRVDERRTASRVAPPRRSGYFELGASVTVGSAFDPPGGYAYGQLAFGYRGRRPVFVQVRLEPTGGSFTQANDTWIGGALVIAGLDSRLFALGMGVGAVRGFSYRDDATAAAPALAAPVVMRFGALDGLHIGARLDFYARDGKMETGGGYLSLQVPTRLGAWIIAQGGGNLGGTFGVDVGYRRLLVGDGGPGSYFLRLSAGLLGVFRTVGGSGSDTQPEWVYGLGGTAGFEARFGPRGR